MSTRRLARELALQSLFQSEFQTHSGLPGEAPNDKEAISYSILLIQGVIQHLTNIDSLIQNHSSNWKVSRMSFVDRNILRIAVYEMKYSEPKVPAKATINEAVEIAKKYGSEDSKSFVNGVLDQIARTEGLEF